MVAGCSIIEPIGEPKIELKTVIPVGPGTSIEIKQPLAINLSDSKLVQETLSQNLGIKEVPEKNQFFGRVKFLPKETNRALRNGAVCINFEETHFDYLVVYMDGIKQEENSNCFGLPEVMLYNPDGWNFDLVGEAKSIHNYNSAEVPFTIEISAENYLEEADFEVKVIREKSS